MGNYLLYLHKLLNAIEMKVIKFRFTGYEAETLRQLTRGAIHELLRERTILQLNFANFRYRTLEVFESLDAILDMKSGNGDDNTRKVALDLTRGEAYELSILAACAAGARRNLSMVCELAGTDSLDFLTTAYRKLDAVWQDRLAYTKRREWALRGIVENLEVAMIETGVFDACSFTTVGTAEVHLSVNARVVLNMTPRKASVRVINSEHPEREYKALNRAIIDKIDFRRIEKVLDMVGRVREITSTECVTV